MPDPRLTETNVTTVDTNDNNVTLLFVANKPFDIHFHQAPSSTASG